MHARLTEAAEGHSIPCRLARPAVPVQARLLHSASNSLVLDAQIRRRLAHPSRRQA